MSNFRIGGMPPVTNIVKNLIIINVLVFAITYTMSLRGINLDDYLALHYWQSPLFRWWQPFTYLFMHADFWHLFFNMFALYMFGSMLEQVWGPKRFIMFYIICGMGAGLFYLGVLCFEFTRFHSAFMYYQEHPTFIEYAQLIRHQHLSGITFFNRVLNLWSANPNCGNCAQTTIDEINKYYMLRINEPMIGASGAVFGLIFAFGYLFPNMLMVILPLPMPIKAKWIAIGYGAIELFSGLRNSPGDNVAHFAHLGGMLFAFILLRIWKNTIRNNFY